MTNRSIFVPCLVFVLALLAFGSEARAQCSEQGPVQHYTGAGSVVCPCFLAREQAGAVFTSVEVPLSAFPIQILRVGIGWGSQFGGSPNSIEEAINIYEGGLPDPGTPVFSLPGPQMIDGFINEFNLIHDGNGCTPGGRNVIFAIDPDRWIDGCTQISGDWVFFVKYRSVNCPGGVPDGKVVLGTPLTAELEPGGDITLSWGTSCVSSDDDYEVYEGTIGSYYSHGSKFCSTGGSTSITFTPPATDRYYLVVPRDDLNEGSYGFDGNGDDRPPGSPVCRPQDYGGCP
jgi:hypothetical protein